VPEYSIIPEGASIEEAVDRLRTVDVAYEVGDVVELEESGERWRVERVEFAGQTMWMSDPEPTKIEHYRLFCSRVA
jgi:hypothetical protein